MGEDDLKVNGSRRQRLDGCKSDGKAVLGVEKGWWSMEDG